MVQLPAAARGNDDPTLVKGPMFAVGMQVSESVRLVRPLGSGGMGTVWRAEHAGLGACAVKFLLASNEIADRDRLTREARLTAKIDHPHAVRVLDRGETNDGVPFLVLELIEGEALSQRLAHGPLPLASVSTLVAQVAAVIGAAHAAHVLHRDIKPANLMLLAGPEELFVKVVDFGIARSTDGTESRALTLPGALIGTPTYMSPEQLIDGRPADVLADLWGLSIVAYEALAGRPPFRGQTRAGICAAMVLKRYERVSKLDASLPGSLDEWFESAFAMERELRPQTAAELASSFAEAALGIGPSAPRTPRPAPLRIPDKVFGRDREISTVLRAFDQASAGRSRVLFVTGYSGIGKTSLITAVEQTLVTGGATFVSGKFDQFNRETPYDSLIQALRELIRKKLRLASPTVSDGPSALGGQSGRALIEVIPELEQLIGPQPALDAVSPEEARNRFQLAVERLVSLLATADHPLVLFFDDLQWADLGSIDLIVNLATDPESRHVLFVGAYRDNEVDAAHPLTGALERLAATSASMEHVSLGPLTEDAVLDLISATFPGASGRARFAMLCHAKTHGNAFFLRRLLESLCVEGPLRFDHTSRQWTWDLAAIEARAVTEDVVDFVAAEIRRMPAISGRVIGAAACVGDSFDLETLAVALGIERAAALDGLRPALASELIVPAAEQTMLASDPRREAVRVMFRFAHDRVRQAARSLVSGEDAARVHLGVARFMLHELDDAERERRLFEIVDHLNQGLTTEITPEDAKELRTLNLAAARRATSSAAFAPAYRYMRRALALLGDDAWTSDYDQTLAMHIEGARSAYLTGDNETMQALVETAAARARTVIDRVRAREVRLHALVSQQKLVEAVGFSVDLLSELGLELPRSPTPEDVMREVGATVARLSGVTAEDIARIPMALDPVVVAMLRIQNDTMSSAYLAVPNLLPIMGCNIVRMTMESGVCKESPYGFAILGLVLSAGNMIDVAHSVAKLATELLGRVEDRSVHPRTLHVVASFVQAFVEPIREAIEAERRAFRIAMDTGDFEYAAWSLHTMVCDGLYAGLDLDELEPMCDRALAVLEHHRQVAAIGVSAQFGQLIANLRGRAADPTRLVGPKYDEVAQMAIFEAIQYRGAAFVLAVLAAFARYLFRDLEAARERLDAGAPYADGAVATYNQVWFHQLRVLTILGSVAPGSNEVAAALVEIEPNVTQLRTWQRFSPVNHDHRVHLVDAEIARVSGKDATSHYDRAIELARANGFAHEVALGNELAYRHYEALGDGARAEGYFEGAIAAYDRWGASAKSAHLRAERTVR